MAEHIPVKFLFLDIDGTITSTRSTVGLGGCPLASNYKDYLHLFDNVAVNLIRKLCQETNAIIVLSSSWRILIDGVKLGEALGLPIQAGTPISTSRHRGTEIAEWIRLFKESGGVMGNYAIVDDDSDFLEEQMPFFVKTTSNNGLLWEHYLKLVELLGKE